ncbi:uncharacterized protein B0T15DRAFT_495593 [Chaetomium strumarium]|uniref:Uncharacterized protein n=1 Tax=Chaetomium strumarium TaxID=1170767 RepID=A0AAJ0GN69_9PEZI|nr:hypothetical protein B0T15DRAFT_495593 [Chaetomium strumarium]
MTESFWLCDARRRKYEIVLATRFSAISSHFSAAVFSTCGVNFWSSSSPHTITSLHLRMFERAFAFVQFNTAFEVCTGCPSPVSTKHDCALYWFTTTLVAL